MAFALRADDRLRRLDHDLHLERAACESQARFKQLEQRDQGLGLRWHHHLRQRDDKVLGEFPARFVGQRREEHVQRADGARLQLVGERLDADADERRQRARLHALRHLLRGSGGVPVLLGIGPVPVAVLEVDPEILDRLVLQLLRHAPIDRRGERLRELPAKRFREQLGRRGVLLQRPQGDDAQLLCRVGLEEMGAAIDGLHRLARGRLAGEDAREVQVRVVEGPDNVRDEFGGEGRFHGRSFSSRMRVIFCCSPAAMRSSSAGSLFSRERRMPSISAALLPVAHTMKM